MRVLVLEDDPSVADAYGEALRLDGHVVTGCSTFEDAREHMRHDPPDALVTDVRVAQYNGLQLALHFRRISPTGCVVVVTGYDDEVIRREVDLLQGQFLLKPVTLAQLRLALSSHKVTGNVSPTTSVPASASKVQDINPRR